MPSYSDVLFSKLALNQGLVAPHHLQESLSALEASQRAGVRQTIGQVLLKRGYLTHYAARQLETARKLAERSRRAKLTVQLLLRHGRPEESLLKSYYETLKHEGFPCQLGEKLVGEGRISAQENEALTQAIDRAWDALYQRELRELSDGLRYRLAQIGGGSGGYGYGNPSVYAMPAYPHNATGVHPAYGATGIHPAYGQTGIRQAYVHPQAYAAQPGYQQMYTGTQAAQPAWGSGPYAQPGSGGYPQQPGSGGYGYPAQQAQVAPANNPLPPSPSPYATGQRQAYMPQAPMPPSGQIANTAEQMAHMHLLPNWALTRERPSYRPGAEQPPPAAVPKGEVKQRSSRKLREPTGTVPGYEYIERLGKGKTGIVYKAKQLSSGRTVALKVMLPVFQEDPNLCQRFLRETKEAARHRNEHLREVYESGQRGGLLFMALEYVEGETLEDKIDRAGKLTEGDVLRWVAQIARGMDFYNRQGLLHRDIKPANILIDNNRRALLCNLGISTKVYQEFVITKQGSMLGNPWYVSPEQGMGTDEIDVRSDLYSLGITLFHCLTGRVPFLGGNAGVIISKHAREPLPDINRLNPKVSPQVVDLAKRLCAKKPEDRPAGPSSLLAELQWIRTEVGGGSVSTPIQPIGPPEDELRQRQQEQAEAEERAQASSPRNARPGFFRRFLRALGLAS